MNGSQDIPERPKDDEIDIKKCPHVTICLKSKTDELEPFIPDFDNKDIFESLVQRQSALEFKLSNLRLMHKAQIIGQLRQAPQINEYSKKLMKNQSLYDDASVQDNEKGKKKIKKIKKIKKKRSAKNEENAERMKKKKKGKGFEKILRNPMSPDIFKHSKSLDALGDVVLNKKKNVIDRTKDWKEQRDKRVEEKKRIKEEFDMLECTFSPMISPKREFNDTGSMITKNFSFNQSLSIRTGNPQPKYITEVLPIPCNYSQLSPTSFKVSYTSGYNQKSFLASARPMANYNLDSSSDSI